MKKIIILFLVTSINIAFLTTYAQTDCEPATITKVEKEGTGNQITWILPVGNIEEIVITQGGNYCDQNMSAGQESFGAYHRFTPEGLAAINGGELTHIAFAPTHHILVKPGHTYTIQIYQSGTWGEVENRNPGTLLISKELDNNTLSFNQEFTINLDTPIVIDASQELWIGYFCTNIDSITTPKNPAGIDIGPCNDGFGNILFYQNQWLTISEISFNYNWVIKGIVQTIDGLTVNIYNNNIQIATDIQGITYFHPNPEGDKHCYKVEVNCLEGGVSSLSNEFCIEWNNINEQVITFGIYPNPANHELRITNYELRDGVIEIIDVYGRKLSSHHLIASSSHQKIDISSLSSGVYFMRLIEGNNSYMQRFIKQ